jgi:putative acetyltransferase
MLTIRAESSEDHPAVRRINELAFGSPNEADLVEALRLSAHPQISLVAVLDGEPVGHIFFSPVTVESGGSSFLALGLAPMAVLPGHQNRGIGSALVREGLRECKRIGHNVVVVLGHAEYYPRFGFKVASGKGLSCEYDVPDEVFMVAELEEGALAGRSGVVKYMREFNEV